MSSHNYYVYILANKKDGTLYVCMTNDLARRISEHKSKLINGFSTRYNLYKLVYYEYTDSVDGAILREKQLKKWKREWKIRLIEEHNKNWDDLYDDLFQ